MFRIPIPPPSLVSNLSCDGFETFYLKEVYMKQIDKEIQQIMATGKFDKNLFSLETFKKESPYKISEATFLDFISFASKDKESMEVFREVEPFITFSYNITDRVFNELLLFAKKNEWMYLSLCHGNLSEEKVKVLKNLNLPESYWY